jgi:arginyl-tRNA synthetase
MNIKELLNNKLQTAMFNAGIPKSHPPSIAISRNSALGDYQANGILAAAKALKTNPRALANRVIEECQLEGVAEKVEVGGPGFINIHLSNQWLSKTLNSMFSDEKLGISTTAKAQTVVVDYSAPNLAKEMHVGHLRSTVIGDAQVRLLEFLGHNVIRQNHIGDWGTQFGMLIAELDETLANVEAEEIALKDLELFYQQSKKHFDQDEVFAAKARDYVVRLQGGNARIKKLWSLFIEQSLSHSDEIYEKLNVSLTRADIKGESAYNHDLSLLVSELKEQGLVVEDQGATVAFLDELSNKDGTPSAVIIQKQGGGYLYATTDLAAIRYRVNQLNADSILYFIDARQSLHMKQVFSLARKAGFAPEALCLNHCAFGTMMGKDGKPFKTRSGGVVKLTDLIDEAISRAHNLIIEKGTDLTLEERNDVAKKVGIGAIKYSDLSKTRTNDYIFDWNDMLSFQGNTAPYLQYAYTRVKSLLRKAQIQIDAPSHSILITSEKERTLAIQLLNFEDALNNSCREAMPHLTCNYLYDLSKEYMSFYEACPILKEEVEESTRISRLLLCALVARTLKVGLETLGIDVMEKM